MSALLQTSRVEAVVKRGWRRRLLVLAVDQSAIVLALVFAGFALLIVLGTQILAWQWLLALAAVGIVLAVFGVRRRLSDEYRVAQMMDQHLSLNDSLSTAWFLQTHADRGDEQAAAFQLSHAEDLARSADPAAAFPFERHRSWIVTAALCVLALGLFAARYLVTRELSLQRSFLPVVVTQVFEYIRHGGATGDRDNQDAAARQGKILPPAALAQNPDQRSQTEKGERAQKPDRQAAGGDARDKSGDAARQDAQQAKNADGQTGDQKRNGSGDQSQNSANQSASNQPPGDKQDAQQDANGQKQSSSLVDRMRDALSSVMAKIKPSGNQQNSQSQSQKSADGQKGSDQAGTKDQNGEGQKDSGKEQSAQEQTSGRQQGQGSAKSQASQGKDSAQSSDKKGSDAQSGVGHSDGDKELKAAEQAKAMGKLAEIIGKRSASLTGEMRIEPSGKQQLQTEYTHQVGQHSDLGGEINRDEVPVEDQQYVREYMELVRKKPAKSTAH
jgi:hypothetical protein